MIKDNIRDYAVAAFARYYSQGCPMEGELETRIKLKVHREMDGSCIEDIIRAQDAAVTRAMPEILDARAVRETLEMFEGGHIPEIAGAVRAVYFRRATRKNDIEFRVRAYAVSVPADTATVYRWLKEARITFARLRGLAVDK